MTGKQVAVPVGHILSHNSRAGNFTNSYPYYHTTPTDMSVDLAKAVGYPSKDQPVSWNQRDLLTYAVGVGAKATDLPVVYGA